MGYSPTGRNHRPAPPLVRAGESGKRRKPTDREAYRERRQDVANRVAARLDRGRDADRLAAEIRVLMAELAECRTPAERAVVEAKVRPLAETRRWLLGGLPLAS
jgi:hypothetical protein